MGRRAYRADEVESQRERIAEVATHLFAERGYAGVTFRSLAERLNCSPMAPYRYFESKEDIFAAVRRRAYERFADAQEAAALQSPDSRARLAALGHAYIRFGIEERDAYRLMFSLAQPNPNAYPELRRAERRAWRPIREAVGAALEAGVLRGDADVLAHVFWSGVHGLVSLHVADKLAYGARIEDLIEPLLYTLFAGNYSGNHAGNHAGSHAGDWQSTQRTGEGS